MKFIDLFAGIGGFHEAFKEHGECVFASEIDKFACQTYEANHGIKPHGDITTVDLRDIPPHDILCAGFPCQSFSIAGKRLGFDDIRGTMFFEIARIVAIHRPKVILLENVKGLVNHDKGHTLKTILNSLVHLGYDVKYKVLNAKDYGVPQNRERIFIVAFSDHELSRAFQWPEKTPLTKTLSDILETQVTKDIAYTVRASGRGSGIGDKHNWDTYTLCDTRNGENVLHSWDMVETTQEEKDVCLFILNNRRKDIYGDKDGNPIPLTAFADITPIHSLVQKGILKCSFNMVDFVNSRNSAGINGIYRITNVTGIHPTLTATTSNDYVCDNFTLSDKLWECLKRHKEKHTAKGNGFGYSLFDKDSTHTNTLLARYGKDGSDILIDQPQNNPRKLTPRECARLQGFPDSFIIPVSNSQAYKQFGNAVCVPVVKALADEIMKVLNKDLI